MATSLSISVLVLDDDPIAVEVAREHLEAGGFTVRTRDNPLGLAHEIRANPPDVVLLDIMMPMLPGDEVAAILKKYPSTESVPIVLYTTKEGSELTNLVKKTGAVGGMTKTDNTQEFLDRFLHFLEKAGVLPAPT